jgi:hypothetical protein
MLVILIGLAAAMLWSGHPSWSGRMLRRWLVERPAEWLSRMSVVQAALIVLSIVAIVAAVHVFEGDGEGVRLVASGLLEAVSWFIAFDVATYLELYAVLWLLGATRQVRAALGAVRGLVAKAGQMAWRARGGWARRASHRVRRDAPPRVPRGEDPEPASWSWLAAAA